MKALAFMFLMMLLAGCDENYGGEAHKNYVYLDVDAPRRLYSAHEGMAEDTSIDNGSFIIKDGKMYLLFGVSNRVKMEYHYWSDTDLAELFNDHLETRAFLNPESSCFGIEWLKQNPKGVDRSITSTPSAANNEFSYRKWMMANHFQYCG